MSRSSSGNVRKSEGMVAHLEGLGSVTVAVATQSCTPLRRVVSSPRRTATSTASAKRVQSQAVHRASTARGMAHEAVNNAILKNLPIGDKPDIPAPDHELPRELGYRGNAGKGFK
jgi:hypothetical protein